MWWDRYGSSVIRKIWSDQFTHSQWIDFWFTLVKVQQEMYKDFNPPVFPVVEYNEIRTRMIEANNRHELEAELMSVCKRLEADGIEDPSHWLHREVTSSDVQDTVYAGQTALSINYMVGLLVVLQKDIQTCRERHANQPPLQIARTHLQPADLTTISIRLDMLLAEVRHVLSLWMSIVVPLKQQLGPVGTGSSFAPFLQEGRTPEELTQAVYDRFDLISSATAIRFAPIATGQTTPRWAESSLWAAMDATALMLHRLGLNVRLLSAFGEAAEGFDEKSQTGSSIMPQKRNPITSENICGLARTVHSLVSAQWDTAAHQMLERSLDDSSARRVTVPTLWYLLDEMLWKALALVGGLKFVGFDEVDPYAAIMSHYHLSKSLHHHEDTRTRFDIKRSLGLHIKKDGDLSNFKTIAVEPIDIEQILAHLENTLRTP